MYECTLIAFGREDGTIISEKQFFLEHSDVSLTSKQKCRLIDNIKIQGILFLQKYGDKTTIILEEFYKNFIFIDDQTHELYFRPLYEVNIKVFFKNFSPTLLIYDMKKY